MPGLEQLQKFSQDITGLGDEPAIREERGEPFSVLPIPPDVSENNDSDDFLLGMPQEGEDNSLLDIDGIDETEELGGIDDGEQGLADFASSFDLPDLDPSADFEDVFLSKDTTEQTEAFDETVESLDEDLKVLGEDLENADALAELASFGPDDATGEILEGFEENVEDLDETFEDLDTLPDIDALSEIESDTEEIIDVENEEDRSVLDILGEFEKENLAKETPEVEVLDELEDLSETPDELPDLDILSTTEETVEPETADGSDDLESLAMDLSGDFLEPDTPGQLVPDYSDFDVTTDTAQDMDAPIEDFGDFDIDNLPPLDSASLSSLNDFETTDGILSQEEEVLDDDFHIPGFSDFQLDGEGREVEKKTSGIIPGISEAESRTSLSEAEYKTFKENLQHYPLNLKIAIQEVIVKNEFTDDAIFGLIEKVLQKSTARQVSSFMSKYLDIYVDVPRDFEKRSVEQYAAYKQSLEYQLKNRLVPALIIGTAAALLLGAASFLIHNFVYKPIKAEGLYKEGYALLEENLYVQSEELFNEAVYYNPVKKWFFTFAEGYREKKQYERSRTMYNRILARYKNDKKAGMSLAEMELYDLANYSQAEEVIKRKVLDYHVNDKDAMLLLGDVYLEWATEKDPALFPQAYDQYMDLIDLWGRKDAYLQRLLRYFIRIDNLREVLPLKAYFLPKKKVLESQDLIELSGYLFDKLYGDLPPRDEFLRSEIEDVRLLLERALEADPSVPEAHYNFARYFLESKNFSNAKSFLKSALDLFEMADERKAKRILKQIHSYSLLGELYVEEQEFLLAEESYAKGIRLFEKEKEMSFLEPNKDVGKIYANLADIDYFISGDLQYAKQNYENAIANTYDNASVRYKIGFIQYTNKKYAEALGSYIKASDEKPEDYHLLLALGNSLFYRGDIFASQAYYERLLELVDLQRTRLGIMFPQVRADHADLVTMYLHASNNLGVVLSKRAKSTGDSNLNADAMLYLTESLRAWDALTRNQETMIRLEGSNLAQQNIKYLTNPLSDYDVSIYSGIPRTLYGEKNIEQSYLK